MKCYQDLLRNGFLVVMCALLSSNMLLAQCGKFNESASESDALAAHSLYRDAVKTKDYLGAFENWKKAYEMAPAADGKRAFHYSDGRKIYKEMIKKESDEAKKKEYIETIIRLYDEQIQCYGTDGEEARLLGRKAFDMFYEFRTPYSTLEKVLSSSIEKGGNDSEYIVFVPYATVVEYLFTNEKMDAARARDIHGALNGIADHNIANNKEFGEQYQQAKDAMNGVFARIEDHIFDCAYFKDKLVPAYQADPDNVDLIKTTYNKLASRGCDEADPILVELKGKYERYAAEENARRQAEFEANNPAVMAKKLYDAGDFSGASAKYNEALEKETDPEKQATIYFGLASIEGRKLGNYSQARSYALKAAGLKSGWGRPYMLIGDLYAKTSRRCGDAFDQRVAILAAIAKYRYARSIDPEVADEANKRIASYSGSKPDSSEAFMRKLKAGDSVKVGCWIGETVKLEFSD